MTLSSFCLHFIIGRTRRWANSRTSFRIASPMASRGWKRGCESIQGLRFLSAPSSRSPATLYRAFTQDDTGRFMYLSPLRNAFYGLSRLCRLKDLCISLCRNYCANLFYLYNFRIGCPFFRERWTETSIYTWEMRQKKRLYRIFILYFDTNFLFWFSELLKLSFTSGTKLYNEVTKIKMSK